MFKYTTKDETNEADAFYLKTAFEYVFLFKKQFLVSF